MKYQSKIYVEKWINKGVKICLDKYETKELFTVIRDNGVSGCYHVREYSAVSVNILSF